VRRVRAFPDELITTCCRRAAP